MPHSMTGYASTQGAAVGFRWHWEIRSVNAKGLDLRLRLPDWITGLESFARGQIAGVAARGAVTVNLRITAEGGSSAARISDAGLRAALDVLAGIEDAAQSRGIALRPASAADMAHLPGVIDHSPPEPDVPALRAVLDAGLAEALAAFAAMRATEGAALVAVLTDQLDQIDALLAAARGAVAARGASMPTRFEAALARVAAAGPEVDPQRVAQEIALLAVKADVTEELDRLQAHLDAARGLLAQDGPVGRKLDFLSQEFNREANTLCAKSQDLDLTQVGLELKSVIEQFREQIQNLE